MATFAQTKRAYDAQKAQAVEGAVWGGGLFFGDGNSRVVPAGYVYSNGQWVSPLTYQTNNLAAQKLGYEAQSAQTKAQADHAATHVQNTAGNRLNTVLQNPASVADTPGYQFAYNQGLEAVNRTAAAKGQLGSGNRLYDLTKYGQGMASQTYNNTVSQLGNFLNKTPVTANSYQTNPTTGQVQLGGTY